MKDWLEALDEVVLRCAAAAGLPANLVPGFDGDGWVWMWRVDASGEGTSEAKVAEVVLRARLDAFGERVYSGVHANARIQQRPEIGSSRTYALPELRVKPAVNMDELKRLGVSLEEALRLAAEEARADIARLGQIEELHKQAMSTFRVVAG